MVQSGVALTYNGEIYNYRQLRDQLPPPEGGWKTAGDTEVLLSGINASGASFLSRIDGMFAFAAWFASSGRLLLARDRFGPRLGVGRPAAASEYLRCLVQYSFGNFQ